MACSGALGVDSTLCTFMEPACSNTKSVKVPPVSTPKINGAIEFEEVLVAMFVY